MSKIRIASTLLVTLSMVVGSAAMAQDRDHHDDRHDAPRGMPAHGPDHGPDHGPGPAAHAERGAGPDHNWQRGNRLPTEYRNRQYVVDDWRGHHLSAPPRGYQWVQAGPDYVLAAVATGVIAQILLDH